MARRGCLFAALFVAVGTFAGAADVPDEVKTRVPATDTAFKLTSFERVPGPKKDGACLTLQPGGKFDSAWLGTPDVHYDGKLYRMWYAASTVPPIYSGEPSFIGLATSADGANWRRANDGKPVLKPGEPGSFDEAQVLGPSVLRQGGVWKMWYCGLMKPGTEPMPDELKSALPAGWEVRMRIGLAVSNDGIHWQRENGGKPVLDLGPIGSTDDTQVMHPSVLREGDGYRMWYAANSTKLSHSMGMATSSDAVHWQKHRGGAPLQGLGHRVTGPAVYKHGDEYYLMLYTREDPSWGGWIIFAAVSTDGFHWKTLNEGKSVAFAGPFSQRQGKRHPEEGSYYHNSSLTRRDSSLLFWYTENFRAGAGGYRMAQSKLNFDWPAQTGR